MTPSTRVLPEQSDPASAAQAPPKLVVKNLSKSFGKVRALDNANLTLGAGECVSLLGPSGSGKTTLLSLIAGLSEPDSGSVRIDGSDATRKPPYSRDIGMVFQNYSLFPHLTIFENIAFPLRMRKTPPGEITERVAEALQLVQLPGFGDRLPSQLSGGQQQRVALARAIVYRPSIVLLDEPLGALDRRTRESMQLEMRHLHKLLGITMLWVTHDQEEALVVSDRVCVMNHARIEQIASPTEIYFRPVNRFVASFLGDSVIFAGRLAEDTAGAYVDTPHGPLRAASIPEGLSIGEDVDVMIRPERISPMDGGVADRPARTRNHVAGRLRETVFLGDVTRIVVDIGGERVVEVKLLSAGGLSGLRAGERIALGWDFDDTVVMKRAT